MDTSQSVLFVELDCLFDTRLATLYSFGEDQLVNTFDESYYERLEDQFVGIDTAEFNLRYSQRNKKVLKDALPTPLIKLISEFVESTLSNSLNSPFKYLPKIAINSYPYNLTDEEKKLICASLYLKLDSACDIEISDLTYEELTPQVVKKEYAIMILYEYHKWIELHSASGAFKTTTCPDVTLIGPAIYPNGLPSQTILSQCKDLNISPFRSIELTAGPLINLMLLPVAHFSMGLKLKKNVT